MASIYQEIQGLVADAASGLGMEPASVTLEHPADRLHGDFSTNAALVLAKQAGTNPRELAERLVASLSGASPRIASIEIAGPGFINFRLADGFFADELREIINSDETYGKGTSLSGSTILVEFTDPNTFKEFHIGHLMSNVIGESLAGLHQAAGANVLRLCYQSDVGLNIAKAIWGMMQNVAMLPLDSAPLSERISFVSNAYVFGSRQYEDDPQAKIEIDAYNKQIYDLSDARLNGLYEKGRAWSIEHFEEIYAILGTTFDRFFFERQMAAPALDIIKDGLAKGVFEESEGAVVYKGEKVGLHTRVFRNKFGLPTYEAKDLALAAAKSKEFAFDTSIVITGNEQNQYFQVVLAALAELMPDVAAKTRHASHGMMRFEEGKMSSRKGNVISGESLIEDMRVLVRSKMSDREALGDKEAVVNAVAVAAIKYVVLRQSVGKDIVFDPEKSLSFEGDSGPYLQYSLTRAYSILRRAEEDGQSWASAASVETTDLDRMLYRFPAIVDRARRELSPQLLVTYLTELGSLFNSFYANNPILNAGDKTPGRLALTQGFMVVMRNGLRVLGIVPLERM
jgi:arginyl-tRNA synthetase